ncbi:MAG: hypothetical protein HKM28_04230 [Flavobacteriaceae bacterium]|nr:hypothetical protein [Flavobacteriaceae bacterium]
MSVSFRCASPKSKPEQPIIGGEESSSPTADAPDETIVIKPPRMPEGAVRANFKAYDVPFYASVKEVDRQRGKTVIEFEQRAIPKIVLPEKTYGATLSSLRFEEFDRDLLLVNAKLKDPVFNKYYLYILKNNQWKQVVNAFAIHRDNRPDTLQPIVVNPKNENEMLRYYSVFDLDQTSSLGYTWRLLQESIPIENQ